MTYITPQTQVLPLIVVATRNKGTRLWEKYTSSYRPDYIERVIGALNNHPEFKARPEDIREFSLKCGDYAMIAEAIDALNGPTPHI